MSGSIGTSHQTAGLENAGIEISGEVMYGKQRL